MWAVETTIQETYSEGVPLAAILEHAEMEIQLFEGSPGNVEILLSKIP